MTTICLILNYLSKSRARSVSGGVGVWWTPLPQAEAPTEPTGEKRRRRYLKEHHKILYYNLLTQCKLIDHLADINEEAQNMYDRLVKQLAEQEGVTEKLKGKDPLEWVAKMNNINSRASEIVFAEIIYTI